MKLQLIKQDCLKEEINKQFERRFVCYKKDMKIKHFSCALLPITNQYCVIRIEHAPVFGSSGVT